MYTSVLSRIPSPVLFRGDSKTAYRDPAILYNNGWFHLFFTLVETEENGQVYMYTAKSKSQDLCFWTPPRKLTPRDQRLNYSSPGNVIRFRDKWVLCLQTYCRENGEKYGNENCRVYTMESTDLEQFQPPRLLKVKGECPVEEMGRMIDPYLLRDVNDPDKWWCFYKQNGVSMSYSYDLEHWVYSGSAEAGENVCVIPAFGRYYLFDSPRNGIGIRISDDCLHWENTGNLLTLGQKDWPWAQGRLTAGAVVDITGIFSPEQTWLMVFHGSGPEDEGTMFDTHASLGIAWSHDLRCWHWPVGKADR